MIVVSTHDVDFVGLQEVRATDEIVHGLVDLPGLHVAHAEAADKGRAGVAVLGRLAPDAVRIGNGDHYFDGAGRWIETTSSWPAASV